MTYFSSAASDLKQPSLLLGGLTPDQFMRRYWQKKPLLIRQALPGIQPPVDRKTLLALAAQADVESRLIVQQTASLGIKKATWRLRQGPLPRRALPPLSQAGWTLLVQSLDLHAPKAYDLLQKFRFIPDARLDDLMMSFATDGGGVGPHYDSYDVFLLQVQGRRRWQICRLRDDSLVPDLPLKILKQFEPEQTWVLEPGDMLYLPPKWAHEGVAQGECMTCSIGFRAPHQMGLASEILLRLADATESSFENLYRDPKQLATKQPAHIQESLQVFASHAVQKIMRDPNALHIALGEYLTEPKPKAWFEPVEVLIDTAQGLRLSPASRMLYDNRCIYLNGESWRVTASQRRVLRQLANQRYLSALDVAQATDDLKALLDQWLEDGWLLPGSH